MFMTYNLIENSIYTKVKKQLMIEAFGGNKDRLSWTC